MISRIIELLLKLTELLNYFIVDSEKHRNRQKQAKHEQNIREIEDDAASFGKKHFSQDDKQ